MWCLLFTLTKIAWCLLGLVSFVLHSNHAAHFGRPVKIVLPNALPTIGLRVTGAGVCVGVGVRYHLAHTR